MTAFQSFILKESRHILRDKRTMLILFGMPVVLMLLFGFAITTDVRNVRTVVVTAAMNPQTQRAVEALRTSEYFTLTAIAPTAEAAKEMIRRQKADIAIIFSAQGKQTAGIQVLVDGADPNMSQQWANYANGVIATTLGNSQHIPSSATTASSASPSRMPRLYRGSPASPTVSTRLLYNPQMRSAYNFVPAIMGMLLMLICAMMTSISIVREKERGTMEVMLASPVHPLMFIVGKLMPYLALAFAILCSILLLARFVLDVPIAGSLGMILAVSTLYIVLALALGLLISNVARTQLVALLMSAMVLLMPIVMLSGMLFPVESMPHVLQYVSAAIPPRYYIQAMRKLLIMGVGVESVTREIAILAAMASLLLTLALATFHKRLE